MTKNTKADTTLSSKKLKAYETVQAIKNTTKTTYKKQQTKQAQKTDNVSTNTMQLYM